MPLTPFQASLARALAGNRTPDSHLAGGAALHFEPQSKRYSNDLDYFHDSVARVATAFAADEEQLASLGYEVVRDIVQPGYVRCRIARDGEATKVEWAHDSAWRFMPTVKDPDCGYRMHPVDVAVNKVLALAGRNEPRDYLDALILDESYLSLGALCWAAPGKDPGFSPLSLIELLRRRGRHQPEELNRLRTAAPIDPVALKGRWLGALERAEAFVRLPPAEDIGCLYWDVDEQRFVTPTQAQLQQTTSRIVPHHGRPGGVLPQLVAPQSE